jgi:Fic family protein
VIKDWVACTYKTVPWRQQVRAGSKTDRMVRSIKVCIPTEIAARTFSLDSQLISKSEAAISAISNLDNAHGDALESLDRLLIRAESIASSKIENLHATSEEYARALYGNNSNSSAVAMVAGTNALTALIVSVEADKEITEVALKHAHRTLMKDVPREQESAGTYRRVQNWIDGSDDSPLGAIFVPPPPETVEKLMNDLLEFANRNDVPALVQAAIAHAQFETIHPFADGNGRIGRALVNAILRRRKITSRVVVPIASFLVANRDAYFNDLNGYRSGHIAGLVARFANAADIASMEATRTVTTLSALPTLWRKKLGTVRSGGVTSELLEVLISKPVFIADELIGVIARNPTSIYNAISKLNSVEILAPLSDRKRNQIWGAIDVLQELDDLDHRIAVKGRA